MSKSPGDQYAAIYAEQQRLAALQAAHGEACANCHKRPGTVNWGDSLALSHGFARMWCARCAAQAQLRHALSRAARIPILAWRAWFA